MTQWFLVALLTVCWSLSAYFLFRLLRSNRTLADKIGGSLVLLIPVVGPLLCWLVLDPPPPQNPFLQSRGPRGEFTHRWIGMTPDLDNVLQERRDVDDRDKRES